MYKIQENTRKNNVDISLIAKDRQITFKEKINQEQNFLKCSKYLYEKLPDVIYDIWYSKISWDKKSKYLLLDIYKSTKKIYLNCEIIFKNDYSGIFKSFTLKEAIRIYKYHKKLGISVIGCSDSIYPLKLKELYDYPIVLYAKGNLELLNCKCVGIVGARDCTDYSAKSANEISKKLSQKGYVIVSGLAYGIDIISHIQGVKDAGTIGVLAFGHNEKVFYPNLVKDIYLKMKDSKNFLAISEYEYDNTPLKMTFVARNRIIAGLCDRLIIIQAKKKSGALKTVDFALSLGKDIFTIPSNIDDKKFEGTNNLIFEGAYPITCMDVIDEIF